MANRHKFQKGGRVAYSGGASNVAKEADDTSDTFKKGGKVNKMSGGKGKAFARGGRSPFSSAYMGPSGGGK